jgi:hypothetical protein
MSTHRISSDSDDDEGCTDIDGACDAEEGLDWEGTGGRLDGWGEIY